MTDDFDQAAPGNNSVKPPREWWPGALFAGLAVIALVAWGFSATGGSERRPLAGFGETAFRIISSEGAPTARRCALLADTEEVRNRGLMGQTDLRGYDGMVFRYSADSLISFHMRNTPLPLSIAWFDATGRFVSASDMQPCLGRADCPSYFPEGPYRFVLEVEQGRLDDFGIAPGSRLELTGAC